MFCAVALSACGGKDDALRPPDRAGSGQATATSTPKGGTSLPTHDNVKGIDVAAMGEARDQLIDVCKQRRVRPESRKDPATIVTLRRSASIMIAAFRKNPDEKFRRGPRLPPLSMRNRLLEAAFVVRTACGGGRAVAQGDRLVRAAGSRIG